MYSVLSHYSQHLIIYLTFCGNIIYYLGYRTSPFIAHACLPSSAVIAQPRQSLPTPGRHFPSPAVPCGSHHFCRHVPGCLSNYLPSVSLPAVLAYTLPSSDTPCSPPHNPGHPPISPAVCLNSCRHMCLAILTVERPSV